MSINVGGIYVETADVSQADLVSAITAFRTKRGAKVDSKSPLDIEELTLEASDTTARLGYAISPAARGTGSAKKESWFVIADTERYSADYGLAEHLAKTFGVRVVWYALSGVTNTGLIRCLGTWKGKTPKDDYDAIWAFLSALPHTGLSFDELDSARARKGFAIFGFKGVPASSYMFGPKTKGKAATSEKATKMATTKKAPAAIRDP